MIIDLKVQNYRSYKEETIFSMVASSSNSKKFNFCEIDGERILNSALIYGPNASGKSNIIRVLYELRSLIIHKPKIDEQISLYDPFAFNTMTNVSPSEIELNFFCNNIKFNYYIELKQQIIINEKLIYYPNGRPTTVFERLEFNSRQKVQKGILGDKFGKKEINVFANQLILSKFGDDEPHELITEIYLYFHNLTVFNATNRAHYEFFHDSVSESILGDRKLKTRLETLIKAADTKINGLEVDKKKDSQEDKNFLFKKKNYNIFGLHDLYEDDKVIDSKPLDLNEESVGTQSLYILGAMIIGTLDQGGVLLVDELDSSLHPFITKMILMLFQDPSTNSRNAQLIFTTHDVTLLDKDLVRRDQIWIAEKTKDGSSDLYSLQDFEGLREDTPFEKWYLAGKFGGIPQVESLSKLFS